MAKFDFVNKNLNLANLENMKHFNGFFTNVYKEGFINGISFVFVTKPLLFLEPIKPANPRTQTTKMLAYENMTKDINFSRYLKAEASEEDQTILNMLSYNRDYFSSSFIPLFTNECKNFDPTATSLGVNETFETREGYRQPLPTNTTQSKSASSLNLTVTEDSNMSFLKMMNIWVNYIENISNGIFNANPEMIRNGILDYTCSIYHFVLDPDGKTLKYWAKYTGCWPTTIPYDDLRYSRGSTEVVEHSINFQYTIKEDMSPQILEDFNKVALKLTDYSQSAFRSDEEYDYLQIKNSVLLNKTLLKQYLPTVDIESSDRDPIVLYKGKSSNSINVDETNPRFELYFGENSLEDKTISSILDKDDYYINYTADGNVDSVPSDYE